MAFRKLFYFRDDTGNYKTQGKLPNAIGANSTLFFLPNFSRRGDINPQLEYRKRILELSSFKKVVG
jgi:hypothetical protein